MTSYLTETLTRFSDTPAPFLSIEHIARALLLLNWLWDGDLKSVGEQSLKRTEWHTVVFLLTMQDGTLKQIDHMTPGKCIP